MMCTARFELLIRPRLYLSHHAHTVRASGLWVCCSELWLMQKKCLPPSRGLGASQEELGETFWSKDVDNHNGRF